MTKSRMMMFPVALAAWLLLNWPPDLPLLLIGIAVSLATALVMGSLFVTRPHMLAHPGRILTFLFVYLPVFLWELVKANLDVAYRVLHPMLPIEPGIVKIRTSLRSDTGITFLANSITLTPGTLTVDVDRENGFLYIHWIKVRSRDVEGATAAIGGKFERILRRIFEEDGVGQ